MIPAELNDAGIQKFFSDPKGPVARDLLQRAELVHHQALANADNPPGTGGDGSPLIGSKTGNLIHEMVPPQILAGVGKRGGLIFVEVGTMANDHGFSYPAFHDNNGQPITIVIRGREQKGGLRPWLTGALKLFFPGKT